MNQNLTEIKKRFDYESAKKSLKEKYQAKMIFAYEGGLWRAGPDLLVLLNSNLDNDQIVLLDLYESPIMINPKELQQLAFERWQEQMNQWHNEYLNILSTR